MKDNEIIEILEDGTLYYFDLDVCEKMAEDALLNLAEKQSVVPNSDFNATVLDLFVRSIYILTEAGWTAEELIEEIINHTQDAEDEADDDDHDA
jgi:hypothetical protein